MATNNDNSVIYSGVGEAFLDQTVRYHCPVFVVFRFSKYKQPCFKRKILKYESGDYDLLNQLILILIGVLLKMITSINIDFNWSTVENDNINTYAENFANKILEFCETAIPSKVVTIRPSDPPLGNKCT